MPNFFAGALFPIAAMPSLLETVAKFMPLTHALALLFAAALTVISISVFARAAVK